MADYAYTNRRYVPQENRNETWDTRKDGYETRRDGYWSKPTGFGSNGEAMSPRKLSHLQEYAGFNNGWSKLVSPNQPQQIDGLINQTQTEPSKPHKAGFLSSLHWRKTHNSSGAHGGHEVKTSSQRPYYEGRNEMTHEYVQEPLIITEGGWTRPSQAGWKAPETLTTLTKPTNDIVGAMSQPVTMAPTLRRFNIPTPMVPKLGNYGAPNIDSRDDFRRFGGLGATSVDTGVIDSREAAQKYHGQIV